MVLWKDKQNQQTLAKHEDIMRAQVNKIISEKEVTAIGTEIQRIIKECYKYMPTNWTTWKKMDNYFLQIYNLLRLKQEELENLRLITNYQGNWSINKTNTLKK